MRTIALSLSLLALLPAAVRAQTGSGANQQSQEITISGPPSCPDCQLVLVPLVRLGKSTDPYLLHESSAVIRDSKGRYYATAVGSERVIAYSETGEYRGTAVNLGQGPGEIEDIAHFHVGPGDSLWVIDRSGRGVVYDPSLALARSFRIGAQSLAVIPDTGGTALVLRTVRTRTGAGLPIHRVAQDRSVLASFGPPSPPLDYACGTCQGRSLIPGSTSGSIWLSSSSSYRVEQWTGDGIHLRTLVRNVSWFAPRTRDPSFDLLYRATTPAERARLIRQETPWQQQGAAIDSLGRLWYAFSAVDHPTPGNWIEVTDVATGRLIATVKSPGASYRWLGNGLLSKPEHTEDGYVQLVVLRAELRPKASDAEYRGK